MFLLQRANAARHLKVSRINIKISTWPFDSIHPDVINLEVTDRWFQTNRRGGWIVVNLTELKISRVNERTIATSPFLQNPPLVHLIFDPCHKCREISIVMPSSGYFLSEMKLVCQWALQPLQGTEPGNEWRWREPPASRFLSLWFMARKKNLPTFLQEERGRLRACIPEIWMSFPKFIPTWYGNVKQYRHLRFRISFETE